MYLRDECRLLSGHLRSPLTNIREMIAVTVDRAEKEMVSDSLMEGYPHAWIYTSPTCTTNTMYRDAYIGSHFLLSHAWSWTSDLERLESVVKRCGWVNKGLISVRLDQAHWPETHSGSIDSSWRPNWASKVDCKQ